MPIDGKKAQQPPISVSLSLPYTILLLRNHFFARLSLARFTIARRLPMRERERRRVFCHRRRRCSARKFYARGFMDEMFSFDEFPLSLSRSLSLTRSFRLFFYDSAREWNNGFYRSLKRRGVDAMVSREGDIDRAHRAIVAFTLSRGMGLH